jgi:NTE family protein
MNLLAGFETYYESNLIPGYLQGQEIGYFRQNHFTSEISLKHNISLNQQFGGGLLFEYSAVYPNKAMQTLYPSAYNFRRYGFAGFGLAVSYGLNTIDDQFYPFEGSKVVLYLNGIYNPIKDLKFLTDTISTEETSLKSFGKLYFDFENYKPLGKNISLSSGLSMGFSTNEFIASDYFWAGGLKDNQRRNQIPFIGYRPGEVVASNFAHAKIGLIYRLNRNLRLEILGNTLVAADSFETLSNYLLGLNKDDLHIGYGGGVTYKTPLGPVSIFIAGNNKDSRLRFYIKMGFTF